MLGGIYLLHNASLQTLFTPEHPRALEARHVLRGDSTVKRSENVT